jgi:histone H3/H4
MSEAKRQKKSDSIKNKRDTEETESDYDGKPEKKKVNSFLSGDEESKMDTTEEPQSYQEVMSTQDIMDTKNDSEKEEEEEKTSKEDDKKKKKIKKEPDSVDKKLKVNRKQKPIYHAKKLKEKNGKLRRRRPGRLARQEIQYYQRVNRLELPISLSIRIIRDEINNSKLCGDKPFRISKLAVKQFQKTVEAKLHDLLMKSRILSESEGMKTVLTKHMITYGLFYDEIEDFNDKNNKN